MPMRVCNYLVWPTGDAATGRIIAEAFGETYGQQVELMVWMDGGAIVALELAGPPQPGLPQIDSVRRYPDP